MYKKTVLIAGVLLTGFIFTFNFNSNEKIKVSNSEIQLKKEEKLPEPNDHWYQVRSYPFDFNELEYISKMEELILEATSPSTKAVVLDNPWLQEGPGNIGGRFNSLAISPTDQDIIYAGACNGGIFKTTDGGNTWNPIFDANAFLAVGAIELDPSDENTIYVGTGDKNFGGGSHLGNGMYRSTDAGVNWTQIGLEQTAIITEIAIDPIDPNRIFASTLGNTYEKTNERGVYRTTDGGTTWQNVLFISDSSGVIDMVMDPSNSDVLYATGFNRINLPFDAKVTGPDAKVFKTIDGGDTWTELSGGLPTVENSRIGLAISDVDPNILYALYVDGTSQDVDDVYKTIDGGLNWIALDVQGGGLPSNALGGFGWYFGEIFINPYNNDHLVIPGVEMFQSLDGGLSWTQNVPNWWTYEVHADKHAITFLDATSYIIATDGGLYKTMDNGSNWTDFENIPATQFYHIDVDKLNPGLYAGGAQDNGTMSGNSFDINNWDRLYGGDGFRITYLVQDVGGVYYETQQGNLVYNNTITSASEDVSPSVFTPDRVNWDMPYFVNENLAELFVGTSEIQMMSGAPYGIHQSISPDLTRVGMGTYTGQERYHTITEIEQSYYDFDNLYVGTSDGLVWRGDRTTGNWDWIDITGSLPERYVTAVKASPNFDQTLYVGMSGYKLNEDISYLYKSVDNGQSWIDISGNLPGITVNDILIVPGYDDEYLFAALDGGVYFTSDGGLQWDYLGTGLPFATISELRLDITNLKLIAGTYSRSMWSYDISWIEDLEDAVAEVETNYPENINFYPNPATDLIYFEGITDEYLDLYDVNGKLVYHKKFISQNGFGQANISELNSGLYFYKNGTRTGKVIKK